MKLYLITQDENSDYDTWDSAVVVAKSKLDAKKIHPSGYIDDDKWANYCNWASSSKNVDAEYLGPASKKLKRGVVVASFHAG